MRGADSKQEGMFSYVSPESRIPTNHPLRPIRAIVAEALAQMDRKLESLYSQNGRPSIAPERLIRALLIARQSRWKARVNQDGKGSRGLWIML